MQTLLFFMVSALMHRAVYSAAISVDMSKMDSDLEIIKKYTMPECDDQEKVDLSNIGLRTIPESFVKSNNIRTICLEGNRLENVPRSVFDGTPNLSCLNLRGNRIPLTAMFQFGHDQLRVLTLGYQGGRNHQLYNHNAVKTWQHTVQLNVPMTFPNLEYLDLSGCLFDNVPDDFPERFPRLTHLFLTDRHITDISDEFIFHLIPATLKSLHLERNNIPWVYFPNLGNIEALYMDGNPLTKGVVELHGPNLRLLSLSNCSLNAITSDQFTHTVLTDLDLSYNHITDFTLETPFPLNLIERFDLSHNRLTVFPRFYTETGLLEFSVSYNYITEISDAIPLPSLKRLSLRGNKITNIRDNVFSRLINLVELDLSENQLASLPSGWMSYMDLQYLNLKSNMFTTIDNMSINQEAKITDLYVKSQSLMVINSHQFELLPIGCTVHMI